jgi:photosystem II stability/assembly factor-like uncharacterized protein
VPGTEGKVILASLWNQALYRSDDGGKRWTRHQLGLTCDYQADSKDHKSPHFRQIQVSNAFAAGDETVFLGGFDGLFKSTDGGRHWTQLETLSERLMAGLAVSPGTSDIPSIAIITYGGGIYTSSDAGKTWGIHNQGLTRTRLANIVFSPNYDLDHTLLGVSNGFLVQSTRSGTEWTECKLGYQGWRDSIASRLHQMGMPLPLTRCLLTPSERQTPYPTALALSPNYASDGLLYYGTRRHGIMRSEDRGQTATVVWDGCGAPCFVSSLVMSPGFLASHTTAGDKTLYAGIHGKGVLKTVDGGETWQFVNNGLTFAEGTQLETDHVWLALSAHYPTDQTLYAGSVGGLFKSIDGGAHW